MNNVETTCVNEENSLLITSTATANSDLIEEPSAPTSDLSDWGIEAVNTHVNQEVEIEKCQAHPPIVKE